MSKHIFSIAKSLNDDGLFDYAEDKKEAAVEWFVGFGGKLKPALTHLNEGGTHDLAWFKKTVMKQTLEPAEDPDRFVWEAAAAGSGR